MTNDQFNTVQKVVNFLVVDINDRSLFELLMNALGVDNIEVAWNEIAVNPLGWYRSLCGIQQYNFCKFVENYYCFKENAKCVKG